MRLKIKGKVIAIMTLLTIIPILSLAISIYFTSSSLMKQQYLETGEIIGEQAQTLMESKVADVINVLNDLDKDQILKGQARKENKKEIIQKYERTISSHGFMDVYFGEIDGLLYSGVQDPTIDVRERPWFKKALEYDDIVWSDLYSDATTGTLVVTASKPVYESGQTIGVVAIDVNLDNFAKDLNEVSGKNEGLNFIVIDEDGSIIIDKQNRIGDVYQGKKSFDENIKEIQVVENTYINKEKEINQKEVAVYAPIKGSQWSVATIMVMDNLKRSNTIIIQTVLIVSVIAVLIGVLISLLFGGYISKIINKILFAIRKMEEGDFTTRIDIKSNDEFGDIRNSFNKMMDTLCSFIEKMKGASQSVDEYSGTLAAVSEEVSASSAEISRTAEEIANGASEQAGNTQENLLLIHSLSGKLSALNNTAGDMVNLAENIKTDIGNSRQVVEELKEKTKLNNEGSNEVEEEILELDRKISEVSAILSTIDGISEQTNLLALNASIEAARAGEFGRGFAVVADEIRKLAGNSQEYSNNIKNIVEGVQKESKETVSMVGHVKRRSMEQSEAVEGVSVTFENIKNTIEEIVLKIDQVNKQSEEMNKDRGKMVESSENTSAISEETAAASQEVTASIEQQTSATEEVATSASKLNELSYELNRQIDIFKTRL